MHMPETTEFEIAPQGTFLAICYQVIDLGHQDTTYMGDVRKKPKIRIAWELTSEKMDDGRPFSVAGNYTLTPDERGNLRKTITSWAGKKFTDDQFRAFDFTRLLGKPCFITVVHNDSGEKTYANVDTVMGLPEGTPVPEQTNPNVYFDMQTFDAQVYETLPDWMKEKIAKSFEYQRAIGVPNQSNGGVEHNEINPPPHEGGDNRDPFEI